MAGLMDSLKDLNKLKQSARQIDTQLRQEQLDYSSPDNRIKVVVNGKMEILSLEIAPELLNPVQSKKLEKMIADTINSATTRMQSRISQVIGGQMGLG